MYSQTAQNYQPINYNMTEPQVQATYSVNYQYPVPQISQTSIQPNYYNYTSPQNTVNRFNYQAPPLVISQHRFKIVKVDSTLLPEVKYLPLSDFIDLKSIVDLDRNKIKRRRSSHKSKHSKHSKRTKNMDDSLVSSDSENDSNNTEVDSEDDSESEIIIIDDDSSDNEVEVVKKCDYKEMKVKKEKTKSKSPENSKPSDHHHHHHHHHHNNESPPPAVEPTIILSPPAPVIAPPSRLATPPPLPKPVEENNELNEYVKTIKSNYDKKVTISHFDLCLLFDHEPKEQIRCNNCGISNSAIDTYITKCNHSFCYSCMKTTFFKYVKDRKNDTFEMKCPSCTEKLNMYDLQLVFDDDKDMLNEIYEKLTDESISETEFIDCINCGEKYENNSRVPKVRCFKCNTEFCTICHTPWHHGSKCPLYIQKMREGNTLEEALKNRPGVVDLLISLFYASAKSGRTFELASPDDVQVYDNNAIIQYREKSSLDRVIERIPPVKRMIEWTNENRLQQRLKELDPGLYNLLSWIVIGSDNDIVQVRPNQLSCIDCEYYRVFYINKSVNESTFQINKSRDGGSYMAFHGSSFGDWHSILRNGLKVMSNTKYLLNGAAHGSGIYHSPTLLYQYCLPGIPWPNSKCQDYNSCCGVIEVTRRTKMPAANENLVTLRYIILMKNGSVYNNNNMLFPTVTTSLFNNNNPYAVPQNYINTVCNGQYNNPYTNNSLFTNNNPRKKTHKNKIKFDLPPANQFPIQLPNDIKEKKRVKEDDFYFDDF